MKADKGLMNPVVGAENPSELMAALRATFGPTQSKPQTLDEELNTLSQTKLEFVLNIAGYVKMAHSWNSKEPYHVLVERIYRKLDSTTKRLVASILQEAEPLKEPEPTTPDRKTAARKAAFEEYRSVFELANAKPSSGGQKRKAPSDTDDFMRMMAASESSGDHEAVVTLDDGKSFTGLYQFGEARLSDYRKATGAKFTVAEFKQNEALQQKVAEWHFADIDKAIDALGNEAKGYNRDGLRAVAHLGGVSGMRKYVHTKGQYNPADAIGTSLSDYYSKFSA